MALRAMLPQPRTQPAHRQAGRRSGGPGLPCLARPAHGLAHRPLCNCLQDLSIDVYGRKEKQEAAAAATKQEAAAVEEEEDDLDALLTA